MTVTRPANLLLATVVAAVVLNLVMQVRYGSLPPLPLLAGAPLLAFALAEALFAVNLRARIRRRPGTEPVEALTAAKAVVLAKASSMAGALVGGAWLGVLGYVLPLRTEFPAAESDTWAAVIGAICAASLVAAGLWLEQCCRTPDGWRHQRDPDDER